MKTINQEYCVFVEDFYKSKYTNKNKSLLQRPLEDIEQIVIHCTAAGTPQWENPLTCINYDLNPNHISRTGLATATYHFYLNQIGEIFQLVSMNIKTAHAGNQNYNSVAICINHNGTNKSEITSVMYNNLIDTICYIFDKLDWSYGWNSVDTRIHFHRDYANKLCPGAIDKEVVKKEVYARLKTLGDNE